jgi:hypothetical protein
MSKTKIQKTVTKKEKKEVSRPGVHAKTKSSKNKKSSLYKKRTVGQGKKR